MHINLMKCGILYHKFLSVLILVIPFVYSFDRNLIQKTKNSHDSLNDNHIIKLVI